MEKIRYFIVLSFFAIVPLAMFHCGGSDSGADDEEETEAGSSDVATTSAANLAVVDSIGGSTSSANNDVSALIKMGVKNQTVEIPEETMSMN